MSPKGGGNASHTDSFASLESYDAESVEGPNLEEREKRLAECSVDGEDADLSVAFVNIRERVADKT